VADGGVTGNVFGDESAAVLASACDKQQVFDAPVLVAQLDFQVQDPFADAVEAEMARFDHAGMYRSHGHLVDLIPGHRIIIVAAGNIFAVVIAEDIFHTAIVGW
jgi:hypothetical protein